MAYYPGHNAFVSWAFESSTRSSYGWVDSDTLPNAPSSSALAGYATNVPTQTDTFGPKKGYAVGDYRPLYDADGAVTYEISVQLAVGSIPLLQQCLRTGTGLYGLPDLCLYVGVSNAEGAGTGYCDVYRYCKCNTLQIQLQSGSAREVTATATFWALTREQGTVPTMVTPAQHRAIGSPLFWHDVQSFSIGGNDHRQALMGATVSVNHNLERKDIRPHLGHDNPLSLVPYEIMPHTQTVEGDLSLHSPLPESYFYGSTEARHWGGIAFGISDQPRLTSELPKTFNLGLTGVTPKSQSKGGGAPTAEIEYKVPFLADDLTIS